MIRLPRPFLSLSLLLLCLALAACGDKPAPSSGGDDPAKHEGQDHEDGDHDHDAQHGGTMVVSSDHKAHFEIAHDAAAGLVRLWVYDGDLEPISTTTPPVINVPLDSGPVQVRGESPDGSATSHEWHFSHKALTGHVHGARLRIAAGGATYTPDLPDSHHAGGNDAHDGHDHDGMGEDAHEHDDHAHEDHADHADHAHEGEGPHHGIVQAFADADGKATGYVEIKLHDDKGDIEVWLATDEALKTPFDLPLDASLQVEFPSLKQGSITLRVRNSQRNEDEDDVATVRAEKTNYFIFPGETGADASWLQGKGFEAWVVVSFKRGDQTYATKTFKLTPHAH